MKFYRLIVSPTRLSREQKREREALTRIMNIPGVLEIHNTYRVVPELMNVELEPDNDLVEADIQEIVNDYSVHQIHAVYSLEQWHELGIRSTLRGQHRTVNDQIITYGKVFTDKDYLSHYPPTIQKLSATSISEWHETTHGIARLVGLEPTFAYTHYHFYGYVELPLKKNEDKYDRWQRDVNPIIGWQAIPWDKVPRLTPNNEGLRIYQKHLEPLEDYSWDTTTGEYLVLHQSGSNDPDVTRQTLINRKLSYHYLVTRTPRVIWELMPPERAAWHAGIVHNPSARAGNAFGDTNPNRKSIGVCLDGDNNFLDTQYEDTAKLSSHLGHDGLTMMTHHDIDSRKPEAVQRALYETLERMRSTKSILTKIVLAIIHKLFGKKK